jgi:hypothetical protein
MWSSKSATLQSRGDPSQGPSPPCGFPHAFEVFPSFSRHLSTLNTVSWEREYENYVYHNYEDSV